jgi:hypothetical protein
LHDNEYHHTHFTGFMLDEEIVASLWGSTSSATRNIFDPFIGDYETKMRTSTRFFWGKFRGEGKIIHSCSNSLRSGHFFTKIKL